MENMYKCEKTNVKLWSESYSDDYKLRCRNCVEGDDSYYKEGFSDQIGPNIPAIPVDNSCNMMYGYTCTSIPPKKIQWWKNLSH